MIVITKIFFRYSLQQLADCIVVFAPDSTYLRGLKVVKDLGKSIICVGSKADCAGLAALSTKQLWLEEIWDFVALTKKKAMAAQAAAQAEQQQRIRSAIVAHTPAPGTRAPDDFSDIEPGASGDLLTYEDAVDMDALVADYSKSTFDRKREQEDHGILLAEERRRRRKNGMISIEQEIEDRKIALRMQAEENQRARGS